MNKISLIILELALFINISFAEDVKNHINYNLRGAEHPVTNVSFNNRGFPKFKSYGDYRLPLHLLHQSDTVQFKKATYVLWKRIQNNPSLKEQFTQKQLADIRRGAARIDGLTWHHSQQKGLLQLVERDIHKNTGHLGGRSKWGGGKAGRRGLKSSAYRKTLLKTSTKSSLKNIIKGTVSGISKYLPMIGIAAQVAYDIRVENKFANLEDTTTTNKSNISINSENIDKNSILITDLETRVIQEQKILNTKIEDNTKNILDIYASIGNIDDEIIQLSQNLVAVKDTINKNSQEITNIKNGILKTGVDELERYYDTNSSHDHLNNAYHDFKKIINIENGNLKPIVYIYYLVAVAELQHVNPQKEYLVDINNYYHKLITLTKDDESLLPFVNASYLAIKEFDRQDNNDFSTQLINIYKDLMQKKYTSNNFDGAYTLAQQADCYVQSDDSAQLLKSAFQRSERNYQENKNFSSKYDLLSKVKKYHNELLLKDASRYLYTNNYNDDLLALLQKYTFQDSEFKLKVYLSLYKKKDEEKYKQLKKLILDNSTYSQTLKIYATSH